MQPEIPEFYTNFEFGNCLVIVPAPVLPGIPHVGEIPHERGDIGSEANRDILVIGA